MEQSEYKEWLENITNSVDALETSYEQRLAAMTAEHKQDITALFELKTSYEQRLAAMATEHKQDIEALLECYKSEQLRIAIISEQQLKRFEELDQIKSNLTEFQKLYQTEKVEHKITKESLQNTRKQIMDLTQTLYKEPRVKVATVFSTDFGPPPRSA